MKRSTIVLLARIAIILLAAIALCILIFHTPQNAAQTDEPIIPSWIDFILCKVIVLPFFAVLSIGWILTNAIIQDTVFTVKTANLFRTTAYIILGDIGLYLCLAINRIIFFPSRLSFPYIVFRGLVLVIVLICVLVCVVLYQYIAKAAEIKADNDSIL